MTIPEELGARERVPPIKAMQLTWHSAFQSRSGSPLAINLGCFSDRRRLCHAAERPIRLTAREMLSEAAVLIGHPEASEGAGQRGRLGP
jgi:hypothetical protein